MFLGPALSGNKNIACATFHHPSLGPSDAMTLSVAMGASALVRRAVLIKGTHPRPESSEMPPALSNLGAMEYTVMYHDGRTANDRHATFGIRMPAGRTLEQPIGSESRALQNPFDRYFRSEDAMSENELAGMYLFHGKADCDTCHAGQFQIDHAGPTIIFTPSAYHKSDRARLTMPPMQGAA